MATKVTLLASVLNLARPWLASTVVRKGKSSLKEFYTRACTEDPIAMLRWTALILACSRVLAESATRKVIPLLSARRDPLMFAKIARWKVIYVMFHPRHLLLLTARTIPRPQNHGLH